MIKNLKSLADRLKGVQVNGKEITAEELSAFLASDSEVEIKVSKLNLLSDSELDEVKSTVSGSSKDSGYVDGMKAGAEQLVKAIRKSKGLEFEGKLKYSGDGKIDFDETASHVAEHFESKVLADAKIEPEKAIKELEGKLKKVQETYDSEKMGWDNKEKTFSDQIKNLNEDFFLETALPVVEGLNKKQLRVLFKNDGYGADFDENRQPFPTRFGKRVVDKMEKPVPFDVLASEYVEINNWNKKQAGKGGGDEKPGNTPQFKTKDEAWAYMEKNNIDPSTTKGAEILKEVGQE